MSLEKILSVSGKSGLYRLVGQMKNGIIVEAIADGKRFPVHGASKVSALEEISIYTHEEEVPLKDVFKNIFDKEGGKQGPDHKDDNESVKKYFATILPDYDPDRVYVSDMVKVLKWYNLLVEYKAYNPADEVEEKIDKKAESKSKDVDSGEKKSKKAPSKKASAKKPAAAATKAAPKGKVAGGGKIATPRKAGGTQRGS
jgi:hypothetical protein